jgi:CO/xanthine dehydrogenase Mo-binding subunit
VHVVITAADIPDQRPIGVAKDHFPLKVGRVRSQRDEIAAVAAESEEIAEAALKLIKVEYEDLPVISNPEDAIKPDAILIHPEPHGADGTHLHLKQGTSIAHKGKPDNIAMRFDYAHGDVVQGEAESDVVVEDTFKLHYVTHCCMGVSGMIAEFDAAGNVLMYSNTQVPFLHKREFAEYLHIDPARIRIIQPPIGGGFGSKLDIYPFEVICLYLARAAKRPVKMLFTREEEFLASPTRQPVLLTLRSGCKKDGTLTFRHRAHPARQRRLHLLGRDHALRHDADLLLALPRAALRLPHGGGVHQQPLRRVLPRATATCRPPSPSSSTWTCWPRRSAWTRSNSA